MELDFLTLPARDIQDEDIQDQQQGTSSAWAGLM